MQYSVVNYRNLEQEATRFDAEFYLPEYLELDRLFVNTNSDKLRGFLKKIDVGHVGLMVSEYTEEGILLLQTQNIHEFFIDTKDCKNINRTFHKKLKKSQVKYGDILLARSGSFGQASIYLEKEIINSADIIIVELQKDIINPFYLVAFLNSKFGVNQLYRFASGGLQGHVNLTILENLQLPIITKMFQNRIEEIVLKGYSLKKCSQSLYAQAEQHLLFELGLLDWKPKNELAFVKDFSIAQDADRFDAEYFQPKYEEIVEAVKKYKSGYGELGNLVRITDKNFTPKENEQYKYIELANISSNGEINGYTENFGNDLPSRARRKVQKGDLIISSIEGSLESIALITKDWKNALCSTGFFAINSDKINAETLLVLLKTKVGQLQLKKGCKGTILTAIGKDELSKIVLPKIEPIIQNQIKEKITKMYETKRLSKSLLEIAKRGVEMAIEEDEASATDWINSEVTKLGVIL